MRFKLYILVVIIAAVLGLIYFLSVKNENLEKERIFLNKDKTMVETVKMNTKDGVEIIGDYYEAQGNKGALLLHMMPADRKSWIKFAEKLQANNFKVLSIDLRGHGESQGGPDGYKKFSDAEHQASIFDVEAGADFLKEKGVSALHLVGASIGANLALKYLAEHPETKSAILLSPGLDYRGVKTSDLTQLAESQAVYAIASEDDQYSFETVKKLFETASFNDSRMIKIFKDAGHGTTIFEKEPEFINEAVDWLNKNQ